MMVPMADEITIDDLKRKQEGMTARIAGLARETNARKLQDATREKLESWPRRRSGSPMI